MLRKANDRMYNLASKLEGPILLKKLEVTKVSIKYSEDVGMQKLRVLHLYSTLTREFKKTEIEDLEVVI